MTAEVSIFLFGKPAWEIYGFEGGELDNVFSERRSAKGREPNQDLDDITEVPNRLLQSGWTGYGTPYAVTPIKDISIGQARKELAALGLNPDMAFEFDDDEEDE